ncbi:MAG: hypothetical protein U5K54_05715 [Cytophagales bacterium]|nr:hypothetical protein [Cytophagales bacterium]
MRKLLRNAKIIEDILGTNSHLVSLNTEKQIQNAIKINDVLDQRLKEGIETLLLDTTTFTHETLLVIFRLLHFKKSSFKRLYISYVGAKAYSTNEEGFFAEMAIIWDKRSENNYGNTQA